MRKHAPTVSVIIPTYNRAHLIGRALDSVLNQTYKDFEVIIIDDGSQDNTKEIVDCFTDRRIRYICLERNMGAGAARNKGIEASEGYYISFQDSDDEWLPDKLKKQVDILDAGFSEVGYVYTDMCKVHRNGKDEPWLSPTIVQGKIINEQRLDYQVHRLGIQTTLIKKECFEKVGIFDERFPRLIDLDFFVRLAKQFDSYHIKEPLVQFHTSNGISSNEKNLAIGRILLLEKYYNEVKRNKKFMARQNVLISRSFYSSGNIITAKKYLIKAFLKCPLYKGTFSFGFRIICGEKMHTVLIKSCRKIKKTMSYLLTNR